MLPDVTYRLTVERMHEIYDDPRPERIPRHPAPERRHRRRLAGALKRLRHPHQPR